MVGYTSRGVGVSGMPIRFNCPAEVTLITLVNQQIEKIITLTLLFGIIYVNTYNILNIIESISAAPFLKILM
jgi:hypothetical protein